MVGKVKPVYPVTSNLTYEITVLDGLLMRGSRIIIPSPLRSTMLEKIHTGHQGKRKGQMFRLVART